MFEPPQADMPTRPRTKSRGREMAIANPVGDGIDGTPKRFGQLSFTDKVRHLRPMSCAG